MNNKMEIKISRYLLSRKLNKDLRLFCKQKVLRTSGNKDKLIDTIIEFCSYEEILNFTSEREKRLYIDAELLSLRKEIGSEEFDRIITISPLNISDMLVIAALLTGPKKRSEILSSPIITRFLELVSEEPTKQMEVGERIIKNTRTLRKLGIINLRQGVWEYSLNPQFMDYFREIEIPEAEELYNRVKQTRKEQYQLGLFFESKIEPPRIIRVSPTETFHQSPGALAVYVGKLGEELAARHLLKKGFDVCRFPEIYSRYSGLEIELALCPHLRCKKTRSEVETFCSNIEKQKQCVVDGSDDPNIQAPCPCTHVFPNLCENCDDKRLCSINVLFHLLAIKGDDETKKPFHAADFIAHKDGQNYLVEVKTNRQRDNVIQEETLRHMQSFGLKPLLVHVTLATKNSTFKIQYLSKKV